MGVYSSNSGEFNLNLKLVPKDEIKVKESKFINVPGFKSDYLSKLQLEKNRAIVEKLKFEKELKQELMERKNPDAKPADPDEKQNKKKQKTK